MNYDEMASILEATGVYRCLRKLQNRNKVNDGIGAKRAIFVDVETTGLDPAAHEVIELAMVPFTYDGDGRIYNIGEPFREYREPSAKIPSEITAITGITDEMVAGHSINPDKVAAFIGDAAPIIAHHATFDRRFLERIVPAFIHKPWACSQSQINWASEGYEGTRLSYLAVQFGFFYDKHRALDDAMAAVELLSRSLAKSGNLAMKTLLDNGRKPTWRIWAAGSPFEAKDILKARGYQWHPGKKSWHVAVDEDAKNAEIEWLCSEIYRRAVVPAMDRITAFERFSEREIPA